MTAEPITVVGLDGGGLSGAAAEAVRAATLLVGTDRYAATLPPDLAAAGQVRTGNGLVADLRRHDGPAVVLTGGDPGFFGVVRELRASGLIPRVLPCASVVQRAFGAIGRPWDDVVIVNAAENRDAAVNVCRARGAVAVLTGPGAGPRELGAGLHGWPRSLVIAEDVGGPNEQVTTVDAEQAGWREWRNVDVVLCLREPDVVAAPGWYAGGEPTPPAGGWALPDEEFNHRGGMLATAEVRAVALARLAPRPGLLVWDVGAGPGAIAVECARLGAAVVAVERDPGQCVRMLANIGAHDVEVCVVEDSAPGAFAMLPQPDVIFIGGGGSNVVAACASTGAARIVVAMDSPDSFGDCRRALVDAGYAVDGCHLSVSRLGESQHGSSRFTATSPTMLLYGTRAAS